MKKVLRGSTGAAALLTPAEFEEKLNTEGELTYPFRGGSMRPLLSEKRLDLVTIRKKEKRLKKYDIALYRDGGKYILHRVVYVEPGGYLIRGDHRCAERYVEEAEVIGVLAAFHRRGRDSGQNTGADSGILRLYGMLRVLLHRS